MNDTKQETNLYDKEAYARPTRAVTPQEIEHRARLRRSAALAIAGLAPDNDAAGELMDSLGLRPLEEA